MLLDVTTLTFAGGFASLSCGLLVMLYWLRDRTASPAFWWAWASCGMGAGVLLLALHDVVPDVLSDIVGPLLLNLCAALTWVAARQFNRRPVNPYLLLAGVTGWFALQLASGAMGGARLAAVPGTAISGGLYIAAAFQFHATRTEKLQGQWPMVGILCCFAVSIFLAGIGISTSRGPRPMPSIDIFGAIHFVGLIYAVFGSLSLITMLKERSEASYKAAALSDPLTGLANRRAFMDRAIRLFGRSSGNGTPISLLAIDMDHFKRINDTFGHATGDAVLRIFGEVVTRISRPQDIAARFGGEEFVVLLPRCGIEAALAIADRIRGTFQDSARFVDGQRVGATISIGVATSSALDRTFETIHANADHALYDAKAAGRNRIVQAGGDVEPAVVVRIA